MKTNMPMLTACWMVLMKTLAKKANGIILELYMKKNTRETNKQQHGGLLHLSAVTVEPMLHGYLGRKRFKSIL